MILFFAGLLTGAVLALVAVRYLRHTEANGEQPEETSAQQDGLNSDEEEAREMMAELNRQFVRMMQYTGKEQRKKA